MAALVSQLSDSWETVVVKVKEVYAGEKILEAVAEHPYHSQLQLYSSEELLSLEQQ